MKDTRGDMRGFWTVNSYPHSPEVPYLAADSEDPREFVGSARERTGAWDDGVMEMGNGNQKYANR